MPQLKQEFVKNGTGCIYRKRYLLPSISCLLIAVWIVYQILSTTPPLSKESGGIRFQGSKVPPLSVLRDVSVREKVPRTTLERQKLPSLPAENIDVNLSQNIILCAENRATPVVAVGDSAPRGGIFSRFLESTQNQVGDIVFKAIISGGTSPEGIFLISQGRIKNVAAIGDESPIGHISSFTSPPALNTRGEVAFRISSESGQGIIIASGGGLMVIAADGDSTPLGGYFALAAGDTLPLALGDDGKVAFTSPVAEGQTSFAIFLSGGHGDVSSIVAVGDSSPAGGTFSSLTEPFYSNTDEVFFGGNMKNGEVGHGIFVASRGNITKVVADGDPTPIGGTFSLAEAPASAPIVGLMNGIIFHASISADSKDQGFFPSTGVFRSSNGKVTKVVVDGEQTYQGETFLGKALLLSGNMDNLCFVSEIDMDSDRNPDDERIFSWHEHG